MSMMWWNWVRIPPTSVDVAGPADRHALPRAAEMGCDLLGPFEWRVEGPRPSDRHVRIGRRRTPFVVKFELLFDRDVQYPVIGRVLVGRADQSAFGTGAVVAVDINDQRIVEFALILYFLDHPADLVVGIGRVAGEHLRLPGEELFLVVRKRIPFRQDIRPFGELRIRGDNPQPLLVGENLFAHDVPAHVELALELVDPLLLRLVRRVASAGNVIDEERPVGLDSVELSHVLDRLIRHVGGEVVVRLADPRENLGVIAEQIRRPLVGLAAHEAVEILEAHSRWPLIEGAGSTVL